MLERKTASLSSPARTARFIEAGQGLGVSSIANPSNQRRIILESEFKMAGWSLVSRIQIQFLYFSGPACILGGSFFLLLLLSLCWCYF